MTARNPRIANRNRCLKRQMCLSVRAGCSRRHYQQFDYSTSDPERGRSEDLLSDAPNHSEFEPPAQVDSLVPPDE